MIEFNQETRQFSSNVANGNLKKIGEYAAAGLIGGAAGWTTAKLTESELRKKYLAEGKTPKQIEKILEHRRSKLRKSGTKIGLGTRFVGGRLRDHHSN